MRSNGYLFKWYLFKQKEKNISGKPTAPDLDIILVNLTLCVLGGFLYGYLTWTLNCLSDKHYKEKQFKL